MPNLESFDPNSLGNPNNTIFGLPFNEDEARLVIVPVPWEVTVSYGSGTARGPEHVFEASLQIDLYDSDYKDLWKQGIYMQPVDKKLMMKSDYLRREAELYIKYIGEGKSTEVNAFMCKSLREVNEGSQYLINWVYDKTKDLLNKGKLVGLLGGDHSTPLGYFKAIAEKHGSFGILQVDAHADLRKGFENFTYSHASIMYNALNEIPEIEKLVQVGIRDYCDEEMDNITNSNGRIITYFDKDIKEKQYEGVLWAAIVDDIVNQLPKKVFISFDIDGLDPKLCPNTGTPVAGGFETEQVYYLMKKVLQSGRTIVGFDLNEVACGEGDWDANVGSRMLYKLCNVLIASNPV
jgi:agmatinase